jgi:phosphate transport system ATP-binding protein
LNSSVFIKGALENLAQSPEAEQNKHIISMQGIDVWYGKKQALKDINLDIQCNRITALIGPSGCGKTTLLRCLNRMNDLTKEFNLEGLIEFEGENIYDKNYDLNKLRQKIGMVFQDPNPFPMSVYNNLVLPVYENSNRRDRKSANRIMIQKLKDTGLYDEVKDRLHESAFKLSGGQQQRLCIARALTIEPKVILLDEPCSALDPISTSKIENLLLKLKEHYSIIIVTHNLQQAARIADYVAFFYQGEIIEQGTVCDMFINPKKKETEDYLRGVY